MLKIREIQDPTSCWNKATDHELVFVLLERDHAAPAAVRAWIEERIRLGLNKRSDRQIQTAIAWLSDFQGG